MPSGSPLPFLQLTLSFSSRTALVLQSKLSCFLSSVHGQTMANGGEPVCFTIGAEAWRANPRPNITIIFTLVAVVVSFAWLGVEDPSKWQAGVVLYILGCEFVPDSTTLEPVQLTTWTLVVSDNISGIHTCIGNCPLVWFWGRVLSHFGQQHFQVLLAICLKSGHQLRRSNKGPKGEIPESVILIALFSFLVQMSMLLLSLCQGIEFQTSHSLSLLLVKYLSL